VRNETKVYLLQCIVTRVKNDHEFLNEFMSMCVHACVCYKLYIVVVYFVSCLRVSLYLA
jgi:hypothetical protein